MSVMQPKSRQFLLSSLHAKRDCDFHPHKGQTVLSSLFGALSLANLAFYVRRTRAAARSFRVHIGILFSTTKGVPPGLALQLESGCYLENARTRARVAGIRNLQASHPWVDNVDLRLSLMGFDVGEEHYISVLEKNRNNPSPQQNQML
jgi:hypothetical protein